MWLAAVITILAVLQAEVLPLFEFALPPGVFAWSTSLLATIVIVLRRFEMPEGWPMSWRLTSVHASLALSCLSMIQTQVLPLWQATLPDRAYAWLTALLGVAVIVARLIAQPGITPPGDPR
ncbi:hypothetical protein BRI9_1137 [plant metagenome]|uniref:Uncharacterized protein n=1 Tax=plant metagenome TaxID=1297885 RepID=A0A484UIK6_9ZZZZ